MNVAVVPPPLPQFRAPASGANVALTVLMWIAWLGVIAVADFMGFLMFAFADSPGAAETVKLMIVPVFVWFGVTFMAGVVLLILRRWWTIGLAFVLAISPPFVVFAGYNLLDGAGTAIKNANAPPPPPARRMTIPPGGFKPTFSATQPTYVPPVIPYATTRPTPITQP